MTFRDEMLKQIYLILSIAMIMASCGDAASVDLRLEHAEALMSERPDSAKIFLESIDPHTIRTAKKQARYALLYSQALDKNYIDETNDSLIRVATDYYREHGSAREQMLAYYYLGRVQFNAQSYQSAILSFLEAEKFASLANDIFLSGLICRNISEIHNMTYNAEEELKYARKSLDCFSRIDAPRYRDYALLRISIAYNNISDSDREAEFLDRAIESAQERADTALWGACLSSYAQHYEMQRNYRKAKEAVLMIRDRLMLPIGLTNHAVLAHCYAREHRIDSMSFYFRQAWEMVENRADSAAIFHRIYWIEKERGNPQKALDALESCTDFQNGVARQMLRQSTMAAQRDYFQERTAFAEHKLKTDHRFWTVSILSICLIFGIVAAYAYRRIQWKNAEVDKYMNLACEIQDVLENRNTEMSRLVRELFRDKFSLIDKLGCRYYERQNTPTEQAAIYHDVKREILNLGTDECTKMELERIVDLCLDGIMQKIRSQIPDMKAADYDLFCYLCASFSYRSISIFMQTKVENVYNRKSRLKVQICNSQATDKDLFLSAIK